MRAGAFHAESRMRAGLVIFALFAVVPSALGGSSQDKSEPAVRQAENRFHQAFITADTKTLDSLLTADFVWMHGDGAKWSKPELIERFRSGKLSYTRDEIDNVKVTLYGATAVVTGHDVRVRSTGETLDYNYTTTYVRQNGHWRVAVFHSSYCACAQKTSPK